MASKERIKEITEKLEQGVQDVFTSDNYLQFLQTMSKFHNYSFGNCLLIAMQKPEATLVAGYKAWQTKFKRQVRKGEKAIQILAPVPKKYKKEVVLEDGTTEEQEVKYTGFTVTNVFDISQTDGEEIPAFIHKLDEDVEGYEDLLQKLQDVSPVPVTFEDIKGTASGFFHTLEKKIVVQSGMPQAQTVKTLVHEIAHSIMHDKEDGTDKEADRRTKEVQAESVAYVVNQYLGLDTSDYSFGYVAGWSTGKDTKELKASLDLIRKTAHDIIDKVA